MKKTVLFLTNGDASNPRTWSNVPYKLTTTFEQKGYNVIKCDISTKNNIFTYAYSAFFKIFFPKSTYYFYRSKLNRKIVNKKIKKIVNKYDDIVDLYFTISYDFSPSDYTKKKVLLFSDWPIDYAIKKRFEREPDKFELRDIKDHEKVINNANYKISLYKDAAEYMNNNYKGETKYLGNVINSFVEVEDFKTIDSRNFITFIGVKAYKESAIELIQAYQKLDNNLKENNNLELHIIGMTNNDFPDVNNPRIKFHGYLNKGNDLQCEEYYSILKKTIVIVNTLEKWSGMSSIIEAMYYYRPIITSKYEEFIKTFGEKIEFGMFSKNNSDMILKNLDILLTMNKKKYQKMCYVAHDAVKDFTYEAYVDKIIKLVEEKK